MALGAVAGSYVAGTLASGGFSLLNHFAFGVD